MTHLIVTEVIAVSHLERVVVGVDLGGAERVRREGGGRPRRIGGGGILGAAVVQDVAVAEGELAADRVGGVEAARPTARLRWEAPLGAVRDAFVDHDVVRVPSVWRDFLDGPGSQFN